MPRFGLLPYYDSDSDGDEEIEMEEKSSDETHHPSAVGSNVNDRWMLSHHHNNIPIRHTESRWKQWNDRNSIAFVETLNMTLSKLNDSIQEQIQVEREKLEQEHRQENNAIQVLCENLQVQNSSSNLLENREQNEDKTDIGCTHDESKSEYKQVEGTNERIHPVETKPKKTDDTGSKINSTNENAQASAPKLTSEPEHVLKANSLLEQLDRLQKSIEPFSKNKAVSKRRLKMKKTVCGKLNTLTDSATKVSEVADEVNEAIQLARQEDAQNPNMALGESYVLDLLASNTIQRIQAESFNGPRGDGLPLAAMIARVASENNNVIPVLEAHIYKVCPMAIPRFPHNEAGNKTSDDELMKNLGMQRDKSGDFESWDRFVSRTENVIAMMANIQASTPPAHSRLGGHEGAADWLERFLESLPPTTPLPLLTAPVLHGFLSGAGSMLANHHKAFFKKSLHTLSSDVLGRLDKGAIGKPSFIRLSKLLHNDFGGPRSKFPPKAMHQRISPPSDRNLHRTSPTFSGAASPQYSESRSGDAMMSDAFENKRITMTSPFTNPGTAVRNKNQKSNGSHRSGAFGFSSSSSPFGSSFGQPLHGFGSQGGQIRNPFERKQGQGSQLCFGKSPSTLFGQRTQPHARHTNQHNAGDAKTNSKKKKTKPPCKFFASGTCRFGSSCRFSHESGNPTALNPRNPFA
ncbi:unnamed protein product [Cylindrotheca closterium]|uniref:mRNA export factor GLE1 n=1 Tax=Cylindrotheca closterium TaxID=2856 RepID=A0AAD2FPK0_9STRA|nr:unnamed protein product [Cylindrotheca closterium]